MSRIIKSPRTLIATKTALSGGQVIGDRTNNVTMNLFISFLISFF